jgi:1,4-dihydroxy-6-naphthoate synthase
MSQPITLGYSPCPNDCFMFDAMVHHRIDTEGLTFEVHLEDVESLNRRAVERKNEMFDFSKLSYHAYLYAKDQLVLLQSGSALGNHCGPLLITPHQQLTEETFGAKNSVVIPGKYTTAHMLFNYRFPNHPTKTEKVFHEIEDALLQQQFDAGVIIHENRFTYQQKGLHKIIDLGDYWESSTGLPIPLGGIFANKSLDAELIHKFERVLKRSIQYAFNNPDASSDYVRCHAQEMDAEVMKQHIELYVNGYSLDLGEKGNRAIEMLEKNFKSTQATT